MKHELLWHGDRYTVVRVGDVYVVNRVTYDYDDPSLNVYVLYGDRAFVEFIPAHAELLTMLANFEITVRRKES